MTSNRYHNIYIDGAVCFWTSSIIDHIPVLSSPTACMKVIGILNQCKQRYSIKLLGYVIMPEHIHLAIWAEWADNEKTFIRQFLRLTSLEIVNLTSSAADRGNPQAIIWLERFRDRARQGARIRVWKERGRAFPVTKDDGLYQKLDYMHKNPMRRKLVDNCEEWKYSSAGWYAGGASLIDIDEFDW